MQNIQRMFHSATVKLTLWYLAGIMILSVIFSILIFGLASSELDARFNVIESRLENRGTQIPNMVNFTQIRTNEIAAAQHNILMVLLYANIVIFAIGGIGSYLWARRTLEPIEAAHEAQARFTSDASHELRTPLTIMKAELELALRDKQSTTGELRGVLRSNLQEVDRMSGLVNTLLRIARSEADSLTFETVDCARDIIQPAIHSFMTRSDQIQYHAPAKPIMLAANTDSLIELCIILLDNALKYSDGSKPVRITSRRKGRSTVEIAVKNHGRGISKEDISRIFHRFYQASRSHTKREDSGYGLGLALAKKITEIHHGEISVTSVQGGETTFTIRLPLSQ
jgi:signal transduction histidine kinase